MTPRTRPVAPLVGLLALALATAGCGSGASSAASAGGALTVRDVTIDRPALPEQAVVRLVIDNPTSEADTLTGVSSPIAERADVHRSTTDGQGRSVMEDVADQEIPARSKVTFRTGGLHVMLRGVTKRLDVGDRVELTFSFAHARPRTVTARVVEPGTQTEHDHE